MQTANGIKAYWRETFKRWWNYRGLWRESLDDQPSASSVYRGLLIAFICLYVLAICVISYRYEYVNGIRQLEPTFIFPPRSGWIFITFGFTNLLIFYEVLWHWGKTGKNRHMISVLMYLILFLIGWLVALNVGFLYKFLELKELDRFIYEASGLRELFVYLMMPALLLSPILLAWIQGGRQALIFSPIFVAFFTLMMWAATVSPK